MRPWYHRFGIEDNPFELDPFKSPYTFVNHKHLLEEVLYLTKSGSIFIIQGEQGSGKTMILKQIIENFKGEGKVAYIDAAVLDQNIDIEEIIDKKGKPKWNLFTKKPKDMIVLIDNIEFLSERNCEKIKYYFDNGHIRSCVFTTTDARKLQMSESLHDRILDQIYPIPSLNKFDALRIVRDRFTDKLFLPDEAILRVFSRAQRNIKRTLMYCDKLCQYAADNGKGEAKPQYLTSAIPRKNKRRSTAQA